jgi:hypothetical protein
MLQRQQSASRWSRPGASPARKTEHTSSAWHGPRRQNRSVEPKYRRSSPDDEFEQRPCRQGSGCCDDPVQHRALTSARSFSCTAECDQGCRGGEDAPTLVVAWDVHWMCSARDGHQSPACQRDRTVRRSADQMGVAVVRSRGGGDEDAVTGAREAHPRPQEREVLQPQRCKQAWLSHKSATTAVRCRLLHQRRRREVDSAYDRGGRRHVRDPSLAIPPTRSTYATASRVRG